MQNRRRLALGLLGIVLVPLMALGIVVAVAFQRAQRDLERHARYVEEKASSSGRRDFTRPVVIGDPVEGNAWDIYGPAFGSLDAFLNEKPGWIVQVDGWRRSAPGEGEPFDEATLKLTLDRADAGLKELREGARRTRVDPGFGLGEKHAAYDKKVIHTGARVDFLCSLITRDHRRGNDRAALETAVALLAVAQDLERGGSPAGAAARLDGEFRVLVALRELFENWSLTAVDLKWFAQRLDALDRTRETLREAWHLDDLFARDTLLSESIGGKIRPGWRVLFSERILRAQALNVCEDGYRRMVEAESLPPHERFPRSQRLESDMQDHPNPLVEAHLDFGGEESRMWTVPGLQRKELTTLTHRSLLRIAVALAAVEAESGTVPPDLESLAPGRLDRIPVCSLTGRPFRHAPGRVWSPGINGVDDGGVAPDRALGIWNAWPGADKDIVWTVKRKAP